MRLVIVIIVKILLTTATASVSGQNLQDEIFQYREEMKAAFLTNARSPLDSLDLQFLRWYPYNESFRVACSVERLDTAQIEIPTYSGINRTYRPFARLHFMMNGQSLQLTVFRYEEPGFASKLAPLFLPFKDETSGVDTYGGGRYLNINLSDLDNGSYILDFNKAYNPWCAYSDGFNCPIPPVENHLAGAVIAGERNYAGPYKSLEK